MDEHRKKIAEAKARTQTMDRFFHDAASPYPMLANVLIVGSALESILIYWLRGSRQENSG